MSENFNHSKSIFHAMININLYYTYTLVLSTDIPYVFFRALFSIFFKALGKKTIDMFPLGAVTMIISNRLEVAFLAILGVLCGHFWNIYTLIATRGHSLQVNGHISKIIIAVVAFFCLHSYNFVNIQFTLMYCHK